MSGIYSGIWLLIETLTVLLGSPNATARSVLTRSGSTKGFINQLFSKLRTSWLLFLRNCRNDRHMPSDSSDVTDIVASKSSSKISIACMLAMISSNDIADNYYSIYFWLFYRLYQPRVPHHKCKCSPIAKLKRFVKKQQFNEIFPLFL